MERRSSAAQPPAARRQQSFRTACLKPAHGACLATALIITRTLLHLCAGQAVTKCLQQDGSARALACSHDTARGGGTRPSDGAYLSRRLPQRPWRRGGSADAAHAAPHGTWFAPSCWSVGGSGLFIHLPPGLADSMCRCAGPCEWRSRPPRQQQQAPHPHSLHWPPTPPGLSAHSPARRAEGARAGGPPCTILP